MWTSSTFWEGLCYGHLLIWEHKEINPRLQSLLTQQQTKKARSPQVRCNGRTISNNKKLATSYPSWLRAFMFTVKLRSVRAKKNVTPFLVQLLNEEGARSPSFSAPFLTFHLHVLRFAELLLAGFLLRVAMVHVGSCCCCGRDAVLTASSVALDLVRDRLGRDPGSSLLARCGKVHR